MRDLRGDAMYYNVYSVGGVIYHHGIKGQKWGDKNGPPYPLGESTMSYSEKKAGGLVSNVFKRIKEKKNERIAKKDIHLSSNMARANRSHNKRYINNIYDICNNSRIDEDSGLAKKTKNYTRAEDMQLVNSKYEEKNGNNGAQTNCVKCTYAYELRRRGYNVAASVVPNAPGVNPDEYLNKCFKGGEYKEYIASDSFEDAYINACYGLNTHAYHDIKNVMLQNEPRGSRGQFCMYSPRGGHSINYEIESNGKIRFIDCQNNRIYTDFEMDIMLSYCHDFMYARLDNLELNDMEFIQNQVIDYNINKKVEVLDKKEDMKKELEKTVPKQTWQKKLTQDIIPKAAKKLDQLVNKILGAFKRR